MLIQQKKMSYDKIRVYFIESKHTIKRIYVKGDNTNTYLNTFFYLGKDT